MADAPTTVPTARSLKQWNAGKELDGRMTVKFTLTDPAEARAWAAWLSDRSMENDQAKKSGNCPGSPRRNRVQMMVDTASAG